MDVVPIVDLSDPRLSDYANLTDVALRRLTEPADGLYIAESFKVIMRALEAGHRPRSVLLEEKWFGDLHGPLERFDVPVFIGPSGLLETLTGFSLHRGALAAMHRPPLRSVAEILENASRVVVLEDIVDHTNVGAIFRSVAALGADAVLITPRCADPLYRRSVRVSMGTVLQVPWTRLEDWPGGATQLRNAGFDIAALALSHSAVALDQYAATAPPRIALVLGTEGGGLSDAALDLADMVVTIPMKRGIDSLNVAAAAAVALYTLRVQARGAPPTS